MEAWFEIHELRRRVGIITDYYNDYNKNECKYYLELQDIETNKYYIVHENKVKFINN